MALFMFVFVLSLCTVSHSALENKQKKQASLLQLICCLLVVSDTNWLISLFYVTLAKSTSIIVTPKPAIVGSAIPVIANASNWAPIANHGLAVGWD